MTPSSSRMCPPSPGNQIVIAVMAPTSSSVIFDSTHANGNDIDMVTRNYRTRCSVGCRNRLGRGFARRRGDRSRSRHVRINQFRKLLQRQNVDMSDPVYPAMERIRNPGEGEARRIAETYREEAAKWKQFNSEK